MGTDGVVAQLCALAPEVERSLRVVQVAAVLRWSGSLFTAGGGRGRWELDVAGGPVPGWLRGQIGELSRHTCGLRIHPLADGSGAGRVRVRLTGTVAALAGQVGLLDRRGRLVRGLSSAVVADPSPLIAAGRLRVAHPGMALEQLGVLAEPPVSKDAIAGRLRRLVRAADTRAVAFGIPDSSTALPGGRRVPEPGRDRDRDVG